MVAANIAPDSRLRQTVPEFGRATSTGSLPMTLDQLLRHPVLLAAVDTPPLLWAWLLWAGPL